MFTKEQEATLKNYIEVFSGAILIVFAISYIATNQENHFNNMGAISFLLAGIFIILKANWEWKKRKRQTEEANNEEK